MSYVIPWWARTQPSEQSWFPTYFPLTFQEDGCWNLSQDELRGGHPDHPVPAWLQETQFAFPASHHELFYGTNGRDTEVVHLSVVNRRMLVILNRWSDRGRDLYNAPETRKQLFAALYQLPPSDSTKTGKKQKLLPLFCHKLTEPLDRHNYGSLDDIYFGNAQRSRNGQVVAVVTALPFGNEDNDHEEETRQTAEVVIYNVTDTKLDKMCYLEIPIGSRTNDSWLSMTISNGGELLSVNTTQNELEQEYGHWRVYRLTDGRAKVMVQMDQVEYHFLDHQFTPEFLIVAQEPDREPTEQAKADKCRSFFLKTKIPSCLAKRMIVAPVDYSKYYELR